MYAVVRRYKDATPLFNELARRQADVEAVIRPVPGFVAYYLIRSEDGGISLTLCEDRTGTIESSRRAADWIRQNLPQLAGNLPEFMEGPVLFQLHQSDAPQGRSEARDSLAPSA